MNLRRRTVMDRDMIPSPQVNINDLLSESLSHNQPLKNYSRKPAQKKYKDSRTRTEY